jgi:hypothetical protein
MAQFNDTGYGTVTLSGTVPIYRRVTAAGAVANATTQHIGVSLQAGISGNLIGIAYANKQGTFKLTMGTDITVGSKVFTAADGKGSKTQAQNSFLCGIALEAAGADGDVIEVMALVGDSPGA